MMIERIIDTNNCAETPENPHRKLKKTRRGKKRKLRNDSPPSIPDDARSEENGENVKVCSNDDFWQKPPEKIPKNINSTRSRMLRPTDVPKAPENSTQFIMDDHEDSNLYFSFETRTRSGDRIANNNTEHGLDEHYVGLHDIDFEYESPDDVDTNAFVEQDFENIYRRAREEELSAFTRDQIMRQCIELEQRAIELEHKLSSIDPQAVINQLQQDLLRLQEENTILRDENARLQVRTLVCYSSGESVRTCLRQMSTDGAG